MSLTLRNMEVDDGFDTSGYLCILIDDPLDFTCQASSLTVNQVKNLMSHLQRALDEHGGRTQ